MPIRGLYAELLAGDHSLGGPYIKAEAGAKVAKDITVFAQGGYENATGWGADVGARWEFGF